MSPVPKKNSPKLPLSPQREQAVSREGYTVDISTDVWSLPYSLYPRAIVDFGKINNVVLRDVM